MGYGRRPTDKQKQKILQNIREGVKYFRGPRHSPEISTSYELYRICDCGAKGCSICDGWGTLPISHHGDYPDKR